MNALAVAGLLMASAFPEQDIPGLRVSAPNQLTGLAAFNCLRADFDGNGELDLLFDDGVVFQQGGQFLTESKAPPPSGNRGALCDLFGEAADTLYIRSAGQYSAYEWRDGAWANLFAHEVSWPDIVETEPDMDGRLLFVPFLHDLDEDGRPEVIVPHFGGLHVYAMGDEEMTAFSPLSILPPPIETPQAAAALWPEGRRRIELAPVRMNCLILFDGPRVDVITRVPDQQGRVRFRIKPYTVSLLGDGGIESTSGPEWETKPVPFFFQPVRLNADDTIDFAGGAWEYSDTVGLPSPVHDTAATLDRGATVKWLRTRSFSPLCMFTDVNGDGLSDIITETVTLDRGRLKSLLRRRQRDDPLRQTLQVYFQDSRGGFSKTAGLTHSFRIRTRGSSSLEGAAADATGANHSINLTGDFNADGQLDAVLRHDPERIAIYFNKGSRFSSTPDELLSVPKAWRWSVADVNSDGMADVAAHRTETREDGPTEMCKVFFGRE